MNQSRISVVVARRLAHSIFVIAGVVVLSFLITRVLPGDPAVSFAGPEASLSELAQVRAEYGLDRPLVAQLANYIGSLFRFDLGVSLTTHQPVTEDIARLLPASVELVLVALFFGVGLGVPLGLVAALHEGRARDVAVRVITLGLVSIPTFWLALILQLTFSSRLGWFPISGQVSTEVLRNSPLDTVTGIALFDSLLTGNWPVFANVAWHLVVPAVVLAVHPASVIAQVTRASLSTELAQDHVRFTRALGYSRFQALWKFSLRPASPPVLALIGLVFADAIVGGFLVENIFSWPGIGSYVTKAIQGLDYPAVTGVTLVAGLIFVLVNTAVDLVQILADPRARVS